MPEIVPIVLDSDRPPQGFGEVVLAPVAPALAQALCAFALPSIAPQSCDEGKADGHNL
jgi:hypothetical protein